MNHSSATTSWKALPNRSALGLSIASLLLASAAVLSGCASGTIKSPGATAATASAFVVGTDAPLPRVATAAHLTATAKLESGTRS